MPKLENFANDYFHKEIRKIRIAGTLEMSEFQVRNISQ